MAPQRILVVDDDPPFLTLMREVLSDEGYRVETTTSGANALVLMRAAAPALVILDVRLEESATGLHVLEEMRTDPLLAPLPVILCTADLRFLRTYAETLGHARCIPLAKPFDLDALLTIIRDEIGAPNAAESTNGLSSHLK